MYFLIVLRMQCPLLIVGEERAEPNESSDSDTDSSLSGGAIAGVTVAAVASVMVVAVAIAAVACLVSKSRTTLTPRHRSGFSKFVVS